MIRDSLLLSATNSSELHVTKEREKRTPSVEANHLPQPTDAFCTGKGIPGLRLLKIDTAGLQAFKGNLGY